MRFIALTPTMLFVYNLQSIPMEFEILSYTKKKKKIIKKSITPFQYYYFGILYRYNCFEKYF